MSSPALLTAVLGISPLVLAAICALFLFKELFLWCRPHCG